jgi:AraC-like DNA-binding protein
MLSKYIPGAVLSGAADLIQELGGNPTTLAENAGVPINSLQDGDIPVDIAAVLRLFEGVAFDLKCPNFGMRLASRNGMNIFGSLWVLLRSARSLRQMLEDLNCNYDMYTRAATISLEEAVDGLCLSWDTASNLTVNTAQGAEYGFALCVYEIKKFIPNFTPLAIEFRHCATSDISIYRELFGQNISFEQARNAIHFAAKDLDVTLGSANSQVHRLMQSMIRWDTGGTQAGLPERIESTVRTLLPYSACTIGDVAHSVGINERTLQNHLKNHNTSFKKIKDAVRYDLALKYLHSSTLNMTEISEILGYSELSAFSRSFRRWHGVSCSTIPRKITIESVATKPESLK